MQYARNIAGERDSSTLYIIVQRPGGRYKRTRFGDQAFSYYTAVVRLRRDLFFGTPVARDRGAIILFIFSSVFRAMRLATIIANIATTSIEEPAASVTTTSR